MEHIFLTSYDHLEALGCVRDDSIIE